MKKIALITLLIALSACGQKGELYLPETQSTTNATLNEEAP